MERNPNDNVGAGAGQSGAASSDFESTSGFGGTSGTSGASGASGGFGAESEAGTFGSTSAGTATQGGSPRGTTRDKLGQVKERASEIKATIADKLDAGAQRLQQRAGGSTTVAGATAAGATADGSTTAIATQQDAMAKASQKVASGMRNTADWLRNNDLDTLRQGVEKEVRTNPGRSLLVAAVAGYLLGKAFRR